MLIAQEYPFTNQMQIVSAVAFLHNFIVIHDPDEISVGEVETEGNTDDSVDRWSRHQSVIPQDEWARAAEHRDRIAQEMWADYIARPARRCS